MGCELLIERQASLDFSVEEDSMPYSDRTESCLNFAISCGHAQICQMLINARADVQGSFRQTTSAKGCTQGKGSALFHAAMSGKSNICQLLVDHGADPNFGGHWETKGPQWSSTGSDWLQWNSKGSGCSWRSGHLYESAWVGATNRERAQCRKILKASS